MKLHFSGRAGACLVDWSGYALVRDNVQHFIEGGVPSARFASLHAIERAVDHGSATLDAARLRGEALRAWYALAQVPLDDAAVSLRTRAIVTGSSDRPTARGTIPVRRIGWSLPTPELAAGDITEQAASFIEALLFLTEEAVDGDTIEVRREGSSPRFATDAKARERAGAARRHTKPGRFSVSAMCLAALLTACGSRLAPPAEAPPRVDAELEPRVHLEREERRELIAPPPAYGNKVVQRSPAAESGA